MNWNMTELQFVVVVVTVNEHSIEGRVHKSRRAYPLNYNQ